MRMILKYDCLYLFLRDCLKLLRRWDGWEERYFMGMIYLSGGMYVCLGKCARCLNKSEFF